MIFSLIKKVTILFILMGWHSSALARSPFGVKMGVNPMAYKMSMAGPNGFFCIEEPPNRDPGFSHYFFKTHHATGVCID